MMQMALWALSCDSDLARSFHHEREARFASARWKPQNMIPRMLQTLLTESKVKPGAMVKPWLKGALEYVDRIDQEAQEEGYPPIADVAKRNARRLLFIAGNGQIEPHVYPSMDGEVAVYFKSPVAPAALLILFSDEGSAGCYWSIRGQSERQRYDDASELSPGFVLAQLRALGGAPLSQARTLE